MSANSNKTVVERFLWAMLKSDRESMANCLAEDTQWYPPTFVRKEFGEVRGRAETIAFLCDNPDRFYEPGSRTMNLISVIGEGEFVAALFDFKARPLRGGDLNSISHYHFRLADGMIYETWEVLCTAEWSQSVLGPPAA